VSGGGAAWKKAESQENPMRTFFAAAVTMLVLSATVGRAGEEKIPLDKVPKAVLDAVKAKFPKGELKSAEKEVEDGKTLYEIALQNNGQKVEVTVTPEGKVAGVEKVIDARDLPKAVTETLEAKYPKATHKKIEEVIEFKDGEEKPAVYEVLLVTADNKKFEVVLTAEGKITKVEDKNKEKKE
jgi:uncharacterized membrane protein YkoI